MSRGINLARAAWRGSDSLSAFTIQDHRAYKVHIMSYLKFYEKWRARANYW